MAGHSQFKNIMHKKGKQDAIRSKLFSKLVSGHHYRSQISACRIQSHERASADAAVIAARAEIGVDAERQYRPGHQESPLGAIARVTMEEIRYEGYRDRAASDGDHRGPDRQSQSFGGRTFGLSVHEARGAPLAETGSVAFMFDRLGSDRSTMLDVGTADHAVMEAAIEAGADDVSSSEEGHEIVTAMDALNDVSKALEQKFGEPRKAKLVWKPQNSIVVDDEAGEKILRLIGALEDNDDVQNVYANFEISDALMQKMQG